MPIRASSRQQISALVADLAADRAVTRETAVARLTVIGARAAEPLAALARDTGAPPVARAAALRVFEATEDPRGLDAALLAIDDTDGNVCLAAIAAARAHLRGRRGAAVVDRLTNLALDRGRAGDARAAAVRALSRLERSTVRPLIQALRGDPAPRIAALAADPRADAPEFADPAQVLTDAAAGRLPPDADVLRRAIARKGGSLPLPRLLSVVERVREREQAAAAAERAPWLAARAAAHAALARRGSRLALYDIRETLERTKDPLPVEFLAALGAVGDASCLEAIAAAHAASTLTQDDWWRSRLAEAFQAIAAREKMTRRHTAVLKIEKRWSAALSELWPRKSRR